MNTSTLLAGLALIGTLSFSADAQTRRPSPRVPPDVSLAGGIPIPLPDGRLVPGSPGRDVLVQTGEIGQIGSVDVHLDRFDDEQGTRTLEAVRIELMSHIHGGFTTSGSGQEVRVRATFDQDYFLAGNRLAGTHIVFESTLANDAMAAYSFFVPDSDATEIDQPVDLQPWIGDGQITLMSVGTLDWVIDPIEALLDYGAGLRASYTVTYEYTRVGCRADVDGDGVVNARDLRAIVSAYGNSGGPEDVNRDGSVNARDLREAVAAIGTCP